MDAILRKMAQSLLKKKKNSLALRAERDCFNKPYLALMHKKILFLQFSSLFRSISHEKFICFMEYTLLKKSSLLQIENSSS